MDSGVAVTPYFFDVLHLDGADLLDAPGDERLGRARGAGARGRRWSPRLVTADAAAAERVPRPTRSPPATRAWWSRTSPRPTTPAGAASAWVKVKPVHTLDLVVLAVEWGSGRREGWLSNIHLGARDPRRPAAS